MDLKKHTIAIVIGTRAEMIKIFPIMQELNRQNIEYYFIHTGQGDLGEFWKEVTVKAPDVVLTKEVKGKSKFNSNQLKAVLWNLGVVAKIRKELKKLPYLKYVIYHGDTMTTSSAAIASSNLLNRGKRYKNVHLESGLRSWNLLEPLPEEFSRRLVGRFSDILFAPSESSLKNLEKLKRRRIHVFGNTIIDSALYAFNLAHKRNILPLSKEPFAILTLHRHENLMSKKRMRKIIAILQAVSIPTYFAAHGNTLAKLKKFGLLDSLKENKNIILIDPLDYITFIYQISRCSLIICDGGTMQEESLIFQKPCIILRKHTERQEGLKSNFQFLSRFDIGKTKEKIREFSSPEFKIEKFKNPYGDNQVSKKIVGALVR